MSRRRRDADDCAHSDGADTAGAKRGEHARSSVASRSVPIAARELARVAVRVCVCVLGQVQTGGLYFAWFDPVVSAAERLQRGDEICFARKRRGHASDGRQLNRPVSYRMCAARSVRH
jgi:hypothetical protein